MTKRLLRSVIEYDQEVSPANLVRNFQHLRKAVEGGTVTWGRPDDEALYRFVEGFFIQHFEMPSSPTVLDYFKSINRLDITERVGDIATERVYARTNFVALLRTLQEDQARVKAHAILKHANEILMKGVPDEKTGEVTKGVEEAIKYFNSKIEEVRIVETNAQVHGDIRTDGTKAREEYQRAEGDRGKALGAISGIREIDEACKGAKKGELWIHAGFPGELKSTLACNWAYNSVTRFKKNVVYVSFEMTREQIRRSILVQHSANARFSIEGIQPLDYGRIRDGELTKEEKDFYFNRVIADFENNPTYTTLEVVTPDREWTMTDVRNSLETLHREFEVGLVILDHGQWIEARKQRKNKDYVVELNSVITDAKRLALTFDNNNGVPVLMLFQINRNGKTEADKNDGVYKMNALTYANNCLDSRTLVRTSRGLVRLFVVRPGDAVWSSTGWKKVLATYNNGVKPVVEVRTGRGLRLLVTSEHLFRTIDENGLSWTPAAELRGKYVLGALNGAPTTSTALPLPDLSFGPREKKEREGRLLKVPRTMTKSLAYLLGAHTGDGMIKKASVGYCGNQNELAVKSRLVETFQEVFGNGLRDWDAKNSNTFYLELCSAPLSRWFTAIGADRGNDGIPDCVLAASAECQIAFLRGIFDTDGHVSTQGAVSLGQKVTKRKTLEHVQLLLMSIGIDSNICPKTERLNEKIYPQEVLRIRCRRGRRMFAGLVGFTEPHKQLRLNSFAQKFGNSARKADLEEWPVGSMYRGLAETYGWMGVGNGNAQLKALNYLATRGQVSLGPIAEELYGDRSGNSVRRAYSAVQGLVRKGYAGKAKRGVYYAVTKHTRVKLPRKCRVAQLDCLELVPRGSLECLVQALAEIDDERVHLLRRLLATAIPQKVVSVTEAGELPVGDLEVGGDHEYAAGGLLTHNCEKTADVITTTYLNDELRGAGATKFTNLKNRDNRLFDPFTARVQFGCRRITSQARDGGEGFVVNEVDAMFGGVDVQV